MQENILFTESLVDFPPLAAKNLICKKNNHILIVYYRELNNFHKWTVQQIRAAYADIDPDVAEQLKEEAVINIQVSFDGTWQK